MQHNLINTLFCQAGPGFRARTARLSSWIGGMRNGDFLQRGMGSGPEVIRRIFRFTGAQADG